MNHEQASRPRQPSRRARAFGRGRSGAAAVELALCIPVVLILAFGMLETCNLVQVRTRMLSAAYEATRLATRPTTSSNLAATSTQVTTYCTTLLTQLGVQGATVTISPASLTSITPLTPVTLTVSAPLSQNAITAFVLRSAMTISVQVTLISE
jgi:Flp pilus assembly protein TadG